MTGGVVKLSRDGPSMALGYRGMAKDGPLFPRTPSPYRAWVWHHANWRAAVGASSSVTSVSRTTGSSASSLSRATTSQHQLQKHLVAASRLRLAVAQME